MPFPLLHVVLSFLLDLAHVLARSDHDQTIELVLLRQQPRLYERTAKQPRPSRWEKVALATLTIKLPDLSRVCLVFTPATLLCMVYRLHGSPALLIPLAKSSMVRRPAVQPSVLRRASAGSWRAARRRTIR
jgi:hypothetical protein